MTFEQALLAALSIAGTVIGVLWKLHLDADGRERAASTERLHDKNQDKEEWRSIAKEAVAALDGLRSILQIKK